MSEKDIPNGSRWRHVKSGNDYIVEAHVMIEKTMTPAVVYSRADHNERTRWVRPTEEFLDGRFLRV